MKQQLHRLWTGLALSALTAVSVPPYGDPNQPYDKLPGTWETYHVKWLKPLPKGKRNVLFIVPYTDSREVVELAQRLDLDYTVIMNVGLLIADNTPGIYTEHGRKLEKSRLSDLFPSMDKKSVTAFGKGQVVYLNGEMNGYMARMEKGDYTGSDAARIEALARQADLAQRTGFETLYAAYDAFHAQFARLKSLYDTHRMIAP